MTIDDFKKLAKKIRSSEVYDVHDFTDLKNLTISTTELHAGQETGGHSHDADELYIVLEGYGKIQIGENVINFDEGEFYIIPRNVFHKVWNGRKEELIFLCVFEKYGDRK